ncbi:hypothetical protein KIN20_028083 [Parelaphostrongylus tenuis]|uniref:Uncharacterized protein n=1 Tax=Parelaphostrongylus tenuis TaxID=148309 RepID=A0AAD5WEE8_PARTN|nr:hypothetical protein KIN20_028083 [Parelaphostrongylus tenuis]
MKEIQNSIIANIQQLGVGLSRQVEMQATGMADIQDLSGDESRIRRSTSRSHSAHSRSGSQCYVRMLLQLNIDSEVLLAKSDDDEDVKPSITATSPQDSDLDNGAPFTSHNTGAVEDWSSRVKTPSPKPFDISRVCAQNDAFRDCRGPASLNSCASLCKDKRQEERDLVFAKTCHCGSSRISK